MSGTFPQFASCRPGTARSAARSLCMLEVETATADRLHNVNPFNQPGVEKGKIIARRIMGQKV